jgi:hypothetical protein
MELPSLPVLLILTKIRLTEARNAREVRFKK